MKKRTNDLVVSPEEAPLDSHSPPHESTDLPVRDDDGRIDTESKRPEGGGELAAAEEPKKEDDFRLACENRLVAVAVAAKDARPRAAEEEQPQPKQDRQTFLYMEPLFTSLHSEWQM